MIQKIIGLSAFFFLLYQGVTAQSLDANSCSSRLEEAKKSYQSGQLEEVREKIENCLGERPFLFSREKMIEGYKLLTESNLFRNDIDEASESFENLLRFDPLFEADTTDPENSFDLIYLSRTYKRKPIVSVYGNFGANYSRLSILQNYATDNIATTTAENYNQLAVGINGAVGWEIPVWRDFTFAMEANFALRSYRFFDTMYTVNGLANPSQRETVYGTMQFREEQFWIDVPVMIRYEHYFKNSKKFIPYAYVGFAPNFLISANLRNIQRNTTRETLGGGGIVGGERTIKIAGPGLNKDFDPLIDREERVSLRNAINISAMAGLGAKFRVGRDFLVVEARYNRFLLNGVNMQNRYSNRELVYEYAYVDNDFRMDNFSLTVGFEKSFYKPRKKRQYNPAFVNKKLDQILKREKNNAKRTTDAELKRELNSFVRDLERDKPGILQDVRRGRSSSRVIREAAKEADKIKGK